MGTKEFAIKHRLRIRMLDDERVIPCRSKSATGRDLTHICRHDDSLLMAVWFGNSARRWGNVSRAVLAAGCLRWQDGDSEGSVLFDPLDRRQAKAIIEWFEPRRRHQPSAAQLAALERARQASGITQRPVQKAAGEPETISS
jgi:hypothetical protein